MTTQSIDRGLLATLRARHITKAVVHYSGGNDDGGCDDARITLEDGTEATLDHPYVSTASGGEWEVFEDGSRVPAGTKVTHHFDRTSERPRTFYKRATEQEVADFALVEALCAPVYARYGSFAGEFSCHGTLTYDTTTGNLELEGYESTYVEAGGW